MLNSTRDGLRIALSAIVTAAVGFAVPVEIAAQALEEVVVTARKREENLQQVPISISAFTSEQMQARGITNNYDVAAFTPNFSTSKRVGRRLDRPVIRGMANPSNRGEANASYFIDGVFVAGSISTATTMAMERVEVLRGPQSAQFGRATFSGAVNYVTRQPTDEWAFEFNSRAGTHDDYMIGAWVSGPIIEDKLAFSVSASWENYGGQYDNNLQPDSTFVNGTFLTDIFDGQNTQGDTSALGEEETIDVLGRLTFRPTELTEINLKASYTDGDDGHYPNNVFPTLNCQLPDDPAEPWYTTSQGTYCGEFRIDGTENRKNIPDLVNGIRTNRQFLPGPFPEEQTISQPVEPGQRRETYRLVGEWVQDIGSWTSTLRASYSEEDFESAYDLDHQEVRAVWGLFAFHEMVENDDYSFEYSIASPVENPLRGKLGVYYYDQERSFTQRSFTGPLAVFSVPPGTEFVDPRVRDINNKSVFGSIGWDINDQWTLDVEARWSEDEKDITSGQRRLIDDTPFPVSDSLSYDNFTPRITLNYRPNDDLMLYLLAAKGNKPGGFNAEYFRSDVPPEYTDFLVNCQPGDPPPLPQVGPCTQEDKDRLTFDEEEQWTYEAGAKSSWWDRRLTANLSAFYIDWTNQAIFGTVGIPNLTGGTTPTIYLFNAGKSEIVGLELETSLFVNENLYLYLNYGYNDGEFKRGSDPDLAAQTGGDGDLTGNTIPESPKNSLVTGFDATARVSAEMEGFLRGDFIYESKRYVNATNFSTIGDRKIVNVHTGVRSDNWTLTFYVRNLFDDDTPLSVFGFVNYATDPITTEPGAPNNGEYPLLYALYPSRGRDAGIEFQYRFGGS